MLLNFLIVIILLLNACSNPPAAITNPSVSLSPFSTYGVSTASTAPSLYPSPNPVPVLTPDPVSNPTPSLAFSQQYTYKVVRSYPHDPLAWTQGLVFADGLLFESTGLTGRSSLRRVDLETGTVLQKFDLPAQYFGEGMTTFSDQIIQLTWQSKVGFVYDKSTFELLRQFSFSTYGWGLTHDASRLIMSDGTANLYFLDPESYALTGLVTVQDKGVPVARLNELEYIRGKIFANIWQTDRIAIIDPQDGEVISWIDLSGLLQLDKGVKANVLNGIAYEEKSDRLFVTGKLWPFLFELELVPVSR